MSMRLVVLAILVTSQALTVGTPIVLGQHSQSPNFDRTEGLAYSAAPAAVESPSVLPHPDAVKLLLEGAAHSSEFTDIGVGDDRMRAFVSYPDRPDRAPVVLLTAEREGMSDWTRALAYQVSRVGFIAVAPDYLSGHGQRGDDVDSYATHEQAVEALNRMSELEVASKGYATREFAAQLPAANGTIASVKISGDRIVADVGSGNAARFALSNEGWARTLAFLSDQTGDRFLPLAHLDHVEMAMLAQQGGRGAQRGQPPAEPPLNEKPDHLPANWVMADHVVATTPRRNEWVDVPVPNSNAKVHTWVVYPDGTQRAGAVLVLHGATGPNSWIRGVADQLAKEGFIALVVDLSSGLGPNGGNFESFRFVDEMMAATQKLGRENLMARIKAVSAYAARMPRSNGRTGSIGFCAGGTNSFTLATDVPEHNASVVYYGGPPPTPSLAKTTAPVLGFYGEDDARITASVEPTRAEMKRLGKSFEAHVYPHATHSFLWFQNLGGNYPATIDSWARTITFYRQHLNTPEPR